MVRAIYSCVNDVDVMMPVASALEESGIETVFWSASYNVCDRIQEAFPGALVCDQKKVLNGDWPEAIEQNISFNSINEEVLNEYAFVQRTYLEMAMTRAGGGAGFEWYELTESFNKALVGAIALVETLKPDVWIATSPAHFMFDYVLYEVCRKKRIKTLMFIQTHLPRHTMIFDTLHYEPSHLHSVAKGLKEYSLGEELKQYVDNLRSTYDKGIPLMIKKNHGFEQEGRYSPKSIQARLVEKKSKLSKDLRQQNVRSMLKRKLEPSVGHYLKEQGESWKTSFSTRQSFLQKRVHDVEDRMNLLERYDALTSGVDFDEKYIYFPMNMQPECTTVPQAGIFSDQLLSLQVLSAAIPDDWFIYVKENPAMFEWHRGSFARHKGYYESVSKVAKVKLLPLTSNPFDLLDRSQMVACSTGTTGWEAVVRGKVAIMFGDLYWYKGFPNAEQVSTVADIKALVEKVSADDFSIDMDLIDKYIVALHSIGYECGFQSKMLEHYQISPEQNTNEIVRSILNMLEAKT
jgi:hypothetical protein